MTAKPVDESSYLEVFCEEPFRLFFPLGIFCGLVGASHWLWYYLGLVPSYSGLYHGLMQIQGFAAAFAVGFLMTSLPRFLEAPRSRPWEILLNLILLFGGALALYLDRWRLAEYGFLALILHMLLFSARRFAHRQDNPPPAFLFVAVGFLCGLGGGLFLLWPLSGFAKLGQSLLEQGMLLGFVMAVGSHLGPRLLHGDRSYPETAGPQFRRKLWIYLVASLFLLLSFPLEAGLSLLWGRLLRALIVTLYLLATVRIHRLPYRRLFHLYFLWLSFWCIPLGLWLSALFPGYEMAVLHITFIGGFGLMTLVIANRVIVAHCNFDELWEKNSWTAVLFGLASLLALFARLAADLHPSYYFGWLHVGAGFWLLGAVIWGVAFIPKAAPWNISPDD